MIYAKTTTNPTRWVLAVPEESAVRAPAQLTGGIISTELVQTTQRYFQRLGVPIRKVEFSWGATEAKARLVDAIVDVTETGSSLRANNLRVIDELLVSTPRLIANRASWTHDAKRQKIEDLALLLRGAIAARARVGLKMNVPRAVLDSVLALLPSERSPTVSSLAELNWVAVEVVVEELVERELVPRLKRAGATGILSYPLKSVVV
jgi:ATP phosphoribosyltransferase